MSLGYVRVTNQRRDMAPDTQPEPGETVIAVDRSHPILGNHRHVLRHKNDRQERGAVIARYDRDLQRDMAVHGPMYQAIRAIADRVLAGEKICLACWCQPLPCHATSIKREVERLVEQDRAKHGS